MPVDLQQFLARSDISKIPSSRGLTVINDILRDMRGIVDFSPQASEIEWDSHLLTAVVTATPQFSIPPTAFNETTHYHHIGIDRLDNPTTARWFVSVSYPGLANPIRVVDLSINEVNNRDLLSLEVAAAATNVGRRGRPLIIWPQGSVIIQRVGDILGTERVRVEYVREVVGGPFSAEVQDDLTGGFV